MRRALRRLLRTPVFTTFAVATLALGLGATTAVSSIVRAVMRPPSGVADVDTLINVYQAPATVAHPDIDPRFSWPDYRDLSAHQTVFARLTAIASVRQTLAGNGRAEMGFGELVGGEYFEMLGVTPVVGRLLRPGDDQPGAPPVAVIGDRVWTRIFDRAPDITTRSITMNGQPFAIVGVAPAAFHGLVNGGIVPGAVWVPIADAPLLGNGDLSLDPSDRDHRWLLVKGRLAPGHSLEDARAEVTRIAEAIDRAHPVRIGAASTGSHRGRPWTAGRTVDVIINEHADRIVRPVAATLLTTVALVLLVACTNLANLMVARLSARAHDVAVQRALGASPWQIVREPLAESALLALAGGVAGVGVARLLLVVIGTDLDVGPAALHAEPAIDALAVCVTAGATVVALLASGVIPALQTAKPNVRDALAAAGQGGSLARWRGRRLLIGAQVAVSVVLLSLATAAIEKVHRDAQNDTGVDLEHLGLVESDFAFQRYDAVRVRQIVAAVLGQTRRQPGVVAVAASSGLPLGPPATVSRVLGDSGRSVDVGLLASTTEIFTTLGIPIVRGRAFNDQDTPASARVAVLSVSSAKSLFGSIDVLGRSVTIRRRAGEGGRVVDEPATIVGVVAETDVESVGRRDHGTAYVPFDQQYDGHLVFSARLPADPVHAVGLLRQALRAAAPEAAVSQAGTGIAVVAPADLFLQVTASTASLLGGFALALALVGLYGALSHVVACRTREIGLRVALGATAGGVQRLVVREGLTPVWIGLVAGVGLGLAARLAIPAVVVLQLPAFNVFPIVVAPAVMVAAALLATYVPARRASRIDPNAALRDL